MSKNLHRIPIVGGDGELVGICSQTDLIHFIRKHKSLFFGVWDQTLEQLAPNQPTPLTIRSTELLMKAFETIQEKQISAVGVVDAEGTLVGVVSGSDVKMLDNKLQDIHKVFLPYNEVFQEPRKVGKHFLKNSLYAHVKMMTACYCEPHKHFWRDH